MKGKKKTGYDNPISVDHPSKLFRGITRDVVGTVKLRNSRKFRASIVIQGSASAHHIETSL